MASLAERLEDGLRDLDGLDDVDQERLAEHVLVEVRRALGHPLEILDDRQVASRWADALDGFYTAETVAELLGGVSRQAVSKRADLLALRTGRGRVAYPRMQFRRSRPAPGMAAVLAAVPEPVVDRWTLAGWLAAGNRALDGQRPVDALHDGRRDRVIELAHALAARNAA
jgi:hypothetical protein